MRTRTRDIALATVTWPGATGAYYTQIRCDGSTFVDTPVTVAGHSVPLAQVSETIRDQTGPAKSKPVWHRRMASYIDKETPTWIVPFANAPYGKVIGSPSLNPRWTKRKWDVYLAGQYGSWQTNSSYPYTDPVRWTISPNINNVNESSLREDCFEKAAGLDADVLLNIVEANQIWPSVKSLANCLPEMARNWKRIRKVIKTASGSYLAWKFGVSPIINDIDGVQRGIEKLDNDVRNMTNQRILRFSASSPVDVQFNNADSGHIAFNGRNCIWIKHYGRVITRPEIRYVLNVQLPQYQTDIANKAASVMRRFTTSPFQLAWEKVPFSFVADWFVDLRGVLRGMDDLVRVPPYKVISFTRSFKYEVETEIHQKTYSSCTTQEDLGTHPCAIIEYKHYDRILVSDGATLPTWKPRFGKNQAGISAALIAQKLFRKQ